MSLLLGIFLTLAGSFWIGVATAADWPISPGVFFIALGAVHLDRGCRS